MSLIYKHTHTEIAFILRLKHNNKHLLDTEREKDKRYYTV